MWTLEYLRGIPAPPDTKHHFPQIRDPFSTCGSLPGLATAGLRNSKGRYLLPHLVGVPLVRSQVLASLRKLPGILSARFQKSRRWCRPSRSENRPDDRTVRASGKDRQQRAHFTLFRVS